MQDETKKDNDMASVASDKPARKPVLRDGWLVLPSTGGVVTLELIEQLQQELNDEELAKAIAFATGKES
jgi:hypothetical protein